MTLMDGKLTSGFRIAYMNIPDYLIGNILCYNTVSLSALGDGIDTAAKWITLIMMN